MRNKFEQITKFECLYECKGESQFMFKQLCLLLVIVITIIALMAISIPKYQSLVRQKRETMLKDNLSEIRRVIKQYIKDKQQAPHSLQDVVEAGYFRQLPIDPIMNSNSTWEAVSETIVLSPGRTDRAGSRPMERPILLGSHSMSCIAKSGTPPLYVGKPESGGCHKIR